jgi:hypothetical protein
MSLFRKEVDPKMWLDEFNRIYCQAMPLVGFAANFFSEKTPTDSDLTTLSESRQTLGSLLRSVKTMSKPRDNRLYRLRADFVGLLYGAMRFCEWRVKQSEDPSRARLANMTAFMVVTVEHWKSLRLLLGEVSGQERP